jgi:hypothetical protein
MDDALAGPTMSGIILCDAVSKGWVDDRAEGNGDSSRRERALGMTWGEEGWNDMRGSDFGILKEFCQAGWDVKGYA